MKMLKKLLDAYKGLPPETRMMLALMGLGTPVGLIYCLARVLHLPTTHIIIGLLGIVLVLGLIGFIVSRLFGIRKRKRARKMASDLAEADDAGPVSMDVRAAIKANNEKFFSAIRDMRKGLGISVYDLPWYIVIGDSGCGKTKLINEGGLTFSTGKPEGYQLGTLQYNWWFTEDAVFVDMAGRLCNPQDDADRREWLAFLDTIAKGRRGFPINGAVVCVSAEHLLQDSPEKHEEDANTALERLRDLQSKLGVTFATYLVITKCDKILGFMQFFDRAERDITFKNQIFGWSRPGDFNVLYDPEEFGNDFDRVYGRLNDLRLRRLNDDADEIELGLAYSFPEEFRTLRDPLRTYVRILFPMIKNPKAVKNLIFRGVYYTSATQQGEVVLKHLRERLGDEAARHFAPLQDLYPRPRPHFVKDLLFRKVFPEFGLVFRNEQQVVRHRKLSKYLLVGTAATFVLLMGLLLWGSQKFSDLINEPRAHVAAARKNYTDYTASLVSATDLRNDVDHLYQYRNLARFLSVFLGSDEPREHLSTVQAAVFEKGILQKAIDYIQTSLRQTDLTKLSKSEADQDVIKSYPTALAHYIRWYGRSWSPDKSMTLPEDAAFKDLAKVVTNEHLATGKDSEGAKSFDLYRHYYGMAQGQPDDIFGSLSETLRREPVSLVDSCMVLETRAKDGKESEAFNAEYEKADKAARQTVADAIERLRAYYKKLADITTSSDPTIQEWMRIRQQCEIILKSYAAILSGSDDKKPIETLKALKAYQAQFEKSFQAFQSAMKAFGWKAKTDRIDPLHKAVAEQRQRWNAVIKGLEAAAEACEERKRREELLRIVRTLRASDAREKTGLDNILWISLKEAGLIAKAASFSPEAFNELNKYVKEVNTVYAHVVKLNVGDRINTKDTIAPTADTLTVHGKLQGVQSILAKTSGLGAEGQTGTPGEWYEHLCKLLDEVRKAPTTTAEAIKLHKAWRPDELSVFLRKQKAFAQRGKVTEALNALRDHLASLKEEGGWGLGEMWPDYQSEGQEGYFLIASAKPTPDDDKKARAQKKTVERRARLPSKRERPGKRRRPTQGPKKAPVSVRTIDSAMTVPKCATREFLTNALVETGDLTDILINIESEDYLAQEGQDIRKNCLDLLTEIKKVYLARYFTEWHASYKKARRLELDKVLKVDTWGKYKDGFKERQIIEVSGTLGTILAQILEHVVWADNDFRGQADWVEDAKLLARARDNTWKDEEFVKDVMAYDPKTPTQLPPWLDIAKQVSGGWKAFGEQVAGYPKLPRVEKMVDPKPLEALKWQAVPEGLQRPLADMWATQSVLEVLKKGRELLSEAIAEKIIERQKELGEGLKQLPYRDDFTTVDPEKYVAFLRDIGTAHTVYGALDEGLPGSDVRKKYFKNCADWRRLLLDSGEEGAQDWAKDGLKVMVEMDRNYGEQAMKEFPWGKGAGVPTAGPVNWYLSIRLSLGLIYIKDGQQVELKLPVVPDGPVVPRECVWKWPVDEDVKARIELIEGKGIETKWPDIALDLLEIDKLTLFALLEQRGRPSNVARTRWQMGIPWDMCKLYERLKANPIYAEAAQRAAQVAEKGTGDTHVGTRFVLTLDRPLPEPIRVLRKN